MNLNRIWMSIMLINTVTDNAPANAMITNNTEFTAMAAELTTVDLDAVHRDLKTLLRTLHEKET